MSNLFEFIVKGRPGPLEVRSLWVAVALSILVHVAALWNWLPQLRQHLLEKPERGEASMPLTVQLAPPPGAPPAAPSLPSASPARKSRARAEIQSPPAPAPARPRQPPIALKQPGSDPLPQPRAPAVPAPSSAGGDLSSYIEAQRRARAEPAPSPPPAASESPQSPPEDAATRSERIVAANLGLSRKPSFGPDPDYGGGIFHIQRLTFSEAEFVFYGWNKDIRRNTSQVIEVRKGEHSDIRLAVIRRMIGIIREHEKEEFLWESKRLGRNVTLSARVRDSTGLEEFLWREFFPGSRPP